jgi:lipopolysaccharide transport system permease protein
MTKREIKDRYAGQMLGAIWALAHPVFLVALYVVVFKYVFKVGNLSNGASDYTIYLLAGMLPWLSFQDALSKTTQVLSGNAQLVKQIVFPVEILPVKTVLACFVNQLIGTLLLIVYALWMDLLTPMLAVLPLLWLFQLLAMAGVGFVLSAIGAYFRDLRDLIQMFCTVGLYTMPVCYMPELVPDAIRFVLYLNPFSYMIWCYQDVCCNGAVTHPAAWIAFPLGSVAVFYLGLAAFGRLKVYFGNVL